MFFNNPIRDIEQFGIEPLTGEACGLGMRVLCDLTQEGVDLWKRVTRTTPTAEAWNSKGIKSVMVPYAWFDELLIFALIDSNKYEYVATAKWTLSCMQQEPFIIAFERGESGKEYKLNDHVSRGEIKIIRTFKRSSHPGTGIDNRHAMSGRIE